MKRIIAVFAIFALMLTSCGERKKALLPSVSGKAGEVIVVIDKSEWNGEVGQFIRDNMASDCPFLPQREPLYTLADVIPTAFTQLFKVHRNLLLVNVDASVTEPGVSYRHDVWAQPQAVVHVSAISTEAAMELLEEEMPKIITFIEQAERDRVITNAKRYQEVGLHDAVAEVFGGAPYFPSGYSIRKINEDFAWIAYETTYTNQAILMYRYPADGGEGEFMVDNVIYHRNEILKANVPGMFEGTYMTTSDFAVPSVTYTRYKGRDFAETRGYWEVYGDFMGGPFVSHSFYSPDGSEIIVAEAFVYAPKYNKRHYLRQVESLLYSFEWEEKQAE